MYPVHDQPTPNAGAENNNRRPSPAQALETPLSGVLRMKSLQNMLCGPSFRKAGTFMAGVEGQILSIVLSLEDGSGLKTGALCFAILGVVTTSFAALYSATTYIWLRGSWTPGPKQFHEWVPGCVGMMVRWCSSFLVVETYSGFVALILFFFKSSPLGVAVFAITIVFLSGLFPMMWGFYYWLGLSQSWLVWSPECRYPLRKASLPPGKSLSWDVERN
ncbi:hypothetical protein B0H17DRAFT_1132885 [Mycena rosella]|uniref:Uncharacterized protein n=1 Tax=Mycena rosella TaxID=1033263 RepID=A0AAD7DMB6_MYCRO|nr:hypothetical protein B0H17DRAFT_1132885 [Mycena rosella]